MDSQKTILIVEDNLDSREIYAEILRDENFEVIEAEHGKEALCYLQDHTDLPDLIIMDLTFPFMTAEEFVDQLNARSEWNNIPVLVVSGQVNTREESIKLKAQGFIKKPFDIDPFLSTIRDLTH